MVTGRNGRDAFMLDKWFEVEQGLWVPENYIIVSSAIRIILVAFSRKRLVAGIRLDVTKLPLIKNSTYIPHQEYEYTKRLPTSHCVPNRWAKI